MSCQIALKDFKEMTHVAAADQSQSALKPLYLRLRGLFCSSVKGPETEASPMALTALSREEHHFLSSKKCTEKI